MSADVTGRRYSLDDASAMQRLASRSWPAGRHPGGLGWELATDQLAEEIVVFPNGDEVAGWAGFERPGRLVAQVDPSRPDVAREAMRWMLENVPGAEPSIEIYEGDNVMRNVAEEAGFTLRPDVRPGYGMCRDAESVEQPALEGYAVRAVEPTELRQRVAVHRTAWRPASLPWHPDHRPAGHTDPDAKSGFTDEVYERVRRTWLYESDLDLVAVAADGTFAACCIVWLDPSSGVAEIEPLGVDPSHRRKGLAGALCIEAVRRVAGAGGREVLINNGPNEAYPAPHGAYAKAGFEVITRTRTYSLRRHG
jgi:GNAT superfamily N-acetyltransferase